MSHPILSSACRRKAHSRCVRLLQARGSAYSYPVAGFFRLTFTLRPDYFKIGLKRFESALALMQPHAMKRIEMMREVSVEDVCEGMRGLKGMTRGVEEVVMGSCV